MHRINLSEEDRAALRDPFAAIAAAIKKRQEARAADAERVLNRLNSYAHRRHVRRVCPWLGLVLLGIAQLAGNYLKLSSARQIKFDFRGHNFRGRLRHEIGTRGGLEIVLTAGMEHVLSITSLSEAENVYHNLKSILATYLEARR